MCICLLDRYSFPKENIKMLIDTDGYEPQPTGHNIRAALSDLVASAKAGDILFVHYSGHGTRLPSENGQDDDTGFDECIVPTDMNLITDDDFRKVVEKVPEGCIVTIVSDSCHSGGLIDNAKEQIGDSTKQRKQHQLFKSLCNIRQRRNRQMQSKSLPLPTLIAILKKKTGKNDIDAGKLRPTLFDIFGDDASPKVKKFMKVIMSKIPHKEGGGLMGMAVQYLQQKVGEGEAEVSRPENGILISGCQSDEISADMPDGEASEAYGAMSNAIQEIIAERDWRVSNGELVERARKLLKKQGILQHPGLYCSDRHVDAPFIC